jgi:hypothetical protein
MTVGICIIAQAISAQVGKNNLRGNYTGDYTGWRRQSSSSLTPSRTTRLPFPRAAGFGPLRRGSAS